MNKRAIERKLEDLEARDISQVGILTIPRNRLMEARLKYGGLAEREREDLQTELEGLSGTELIHVDHDRIQEAINRYRRRDNE